MAKIDREKFSAVIEQAKLLPKHNFIAYAGMARRLETLPLSHQEHQEAVKELAKVMEV